jgi:hypothetical protein
MLFELEDKGYLTVNRSLYQLTILGASFMKSVKTVIEIQKGKKFGYNLF